MPVPTIDLLPEVPIRGAPTFSPQMNLFLSALPTFQTQTNASIGAINTALTDIQADVDAAAASASSASGFATTSVNAKNDAVQAKEDAQDILVLVENIAAGISFTSTSTTSLTVEVGSKTWTVQTDESYAAGMPIAAVKVGDPDVYMVGICTAYTGDQLTVAVSQVKGSGSVSNWNISIGGIPGLPGPTFTGGTLTSAINLAPPVTIASGSTVAIGAAASNLITISGTTTITAFDSISAGAERKLTFSGALTLTHNGTSLILPGAANVTTEAGDTATFVSLGSGNWRCIDYQRASGLPLKPSNAIGDVLVSAQAPAAGTWLKSGIYTTSSYTALAALLGSISDLRAAYAYSATTSSSSGNGMSPSLDNNSLDQISAVSGNNIVWATSTGLITVQETSSFSWVSETLNSTIGGGGSRVGLAANGSGRVVYVNTNGSHTYYSLSTDHGQTWSTATTLVNNFVATTVGFQGGLFIVAGANSSGNGAVYTSPSASGTAWTSRTVTNGSGASEANGVRIPPYTHGSSISTSWRSMKLTTTDGGLNWTGYYYPYAGIPSGYGNYASTNGKQAMIVSNPTSFTGSEANYLWCDDITQTPASFYPIRPNRGLFSSDVNNSGVIFAFGYFWIMTSGSSMSWLLKVNASDPSDITYLPGGSWMGSGNLLKAATALGIYNGGPNTIGWISCFSYNKSTQFYVPPARGLPAGTEAYMKAL